MPSDVLGGAEHQIARCQSEHPDIYDAHYDAIEQLEAASIVLARAGLGAETREKSLAFMTASRGLNSRA